MRPTRASAASPSRPKLADALPAVAFAEDSLRQVLLNLLMNAIDATPRDAAVSVGTCAREDSIEVAVCDMGPGIAPELRERVFEPFFTTRGGPPRRHRPRHRPQPRRAGGRPHQRARRGHGRRHLRRDAAGGGKALAPEVNLSRRPGKPRATLRVPAPPGPRQRSDRSRGSRRSARGAPVPRARRAAAGGAIASSSPVTISTRPTTARERRGVEQLRRRGDEHQAHDARAAARGAQRGRRAEGVAAGEDLAVDGLLEVVERRA